MLKRRLAEFGAAMALVAACGTADDNPEGGSKADSGEVEAGDGTDDSADAATTDDGRDAGAGDPVSESCQAILRSDSSMKDGKYTLDLDGDGPARAREYYCDVSGGGWTLIANQAASESLPDNKSTVNEGAFGETSASYRLGMPEVALIRPSVAWKLSDDSNAVYFRPSCIVDWNKNYTDDTLPTDCTRGYTSTSFTTTVNAGWVRASVRGIGINNSGAVCSIRIYEAHFRNDGTEETSSRPAGVAGPCNYYDTKQRVSLWFK